MRSFSLVDFLSTLAETDLFPALPELPEVHEFQDEDEFSFYEAIRHDIQQYSAFRQNLTCDLAIVTCSANRREAIEKKKLAGEVEKDEDEMHALRAWREVIRVLRSSPVAHDTIEGYLTRHLKGSQDPLRWIAAVKKHMQGANRIYALHLLLKDFSVSPESAASAQILEEIQALLPVGSPLINDIICSDAEEIDRLWANWQGNSMNDTVSISNRYTVLPMESLALVAQGMLDETLWLKAMTLPETTSAFFRTWLDAIKAPRSEHEKMAEVMLAMIQGEGREGLNTSYLNNLENLFKLISPEFIRATFNQTQLLFFKTFLPEPFERADQALLSQWGNQFMPESNGLTQEEEKSFLSLQASVLDDAINFVRVKTKIIQIITTSLAEISTLPDANQQPALRAWLIVRGLTQYLTKRGVVLSIEKLQELIVNDLEVLLEGIFYARQAKHHLFACGGGGNIAPVSAEEEPWMLRKYWDEARRFAGQASVLSPLSHVGRLGEVAEKLPQVMKKYAVTSDLMESVCIGENSLQLFSQFILTYGVERQRQELYRWVALESSNLFSLKYDEHYHCYYPTEWTSLALAEFSDEAQALVLHYYRTVSAYWIEMHFHAKKIQALLDKIRDCENLKSVLDIVDLFELKACREAFNRISQIKGALRVQPTDILAALSSTSSSRSAKRQVNSYHNFCCSYASSVQFTEFSEILCTHLPSRVYAVDETGHLSVVQSDVKLSALFDFLEDHFRIISKKLNVKKLKSLLGVFFDENEKRDSTLQIRQQLRRFIQSCENQGIANEEELAAIKMLGDFFTLSGENYIEIRCMLKDKILLQEFVDWINQGDLSELKQFSSNNALKRIAESLARFLTLGKSSAEIKIWFIRNIEKYWGKSEVDEGGFHVSWGELQLLHYISPCIYEETKAHHTRRAEQLSQLVENVFRSLKEKSMNWWGKERVFLFEQDYHTAGINYDEIADEVMLLTEADTLASVKYIQENTLPAMQHWLAHYPGDENYPLALVLMFNDVPTKEEKAVEAAEKALVNYDQSWIGQYAEPYWTTFWVWQGQGNHTRAPLVASLNAAKNRIISKEKLLVTLAKKRFIFLMEKDVLPWLITEDSGLYPENLCRQAMRQQDESLMQAALQEQGFIDFVREQMNTALLSYNSLVPTKKMQWQHVVMKLGTEKEKARWQYYARSHALSAFEEKIAQNTLSEEDIEALAPYEPMTTDRQVVKKLVEWREKSVFMHETTDGQYSLRWQPGSTLLAKALFPSYEEEVDKSQFTAWLVDCLSANEVETYYQSLDLKTHKNYVKRLSAFIDKKVTLKTGLEFIDEVYLHEVIEAGKRFIARPQSTTPLGVALKIFVRELSCVFDETREPSDCAPIEAQHLKVIQELEKAKVDLQLYDRWWGLNSKVSRETLVRKVKIGVEQLNAINHFLNEYKKSIKSLKEAMQSQGLPLIHDVTTALRQIDQNASKESYETLKEKQEGFIELLKTNHQLAKHRRLMLLEFHNERLAFMRSRIKAGENDIEQSYFYEVLIQTSPLKDEKNQLIHLPTIPNEGFGLISERLNVCYEAILQLVEAINDNEDAVELVFIRYCFEIVTLTAADLVMMIQWLDRDRMRDLRAALSPALFERMRGTLAEPYLILIKESAQWINYDFSEIQQEQLTSLILEPWKKALEKQGVVSEKEIPYLLRIKQAIDIMDEGFDDAVNIIESLLKVFPIFSEASVAIHEKINQFVDRFSKKLEREFGVLESQLNNAVIDHLPGYLPTVKRWVDFLSDHEELLKLLIRYGNKDSLNYLFAKPFQNLYLLISEGLYSEIYHPTEVVSLLKTRLVRLEHPMPLLRKLIPLGEATLFSSQIDFLQRFHQMTVTFFSDESSAENTHEISQTLVNLEVLGKDLVGLRSVALLNFNSSDFRALTALKKTDWNIDGIAHQKLFKKIAALKDSRESADDYKKEKFTVEETVAIQKILEQKRLKSIADKLLRFTEDRINERFETANKQIIRVLVKGNLSERNRLLEWMIQVDRSTLIKQGDDYLSAKDFIEIKKREIRGIIDSVLIDDPEAKEAVLSMLCSEKYYSRAAGKARIYQSRLLTKEQKTTADDFVATLLPKYTLLIRLRALCLVHYNSSLNLRKAYVSEVLKLGNIPYSVYDVCSPMGWKESRDWQSLEESLLAINDRLAVSEGAIDQALLQEKHSLENAIELALFSQLKIQSDHLRESIQYVQHHGTAEEKMILESQMQAFIVELGQVTERCVNECLAESEKEDGELYFKQLVKKADQFVDERISLIEEGIDDDTYQLYKKIALLKQMKLYGVELLLMTDLFHPEHGLYNDIPKSILLQGFFEFYGTKAETHSERETSSPRSAGLFGRESSTRLLLLSPELSGREMGSEGSLLGGRLLSPARA